MPDKTGVIPVELWEDCVPLQQATLDALGVTDIKAVTYEDISKIQKLSYVASLPTVKSSRIPDLISDFESLQQLIINNGNITELSAEIYNISLNTLDLKYNNITIFPAIAEDSPIINSLSILSISFNDFEEFPKEVIKFSNITRLFFEEINTSENDWPFPSEVLFLKKLQYFNARRNKIVDFPEELWDLPDLYGIYLSSNKISEIPNGVSKLNFRDIYFDVADNQIQKIPDDFNTNNRRFVILNMNNNLIEEINSPIGNPKIDNTTLYLSGNLINTIDKSFSETTFDTINLNYNLIADYKPWMDGLKVQKIELNSNQITNLPVDYPDSTVLVEFGNMIENYPIYHKQLISQIDKKTIAYGEILDVKDLFSNIEVIKFDGSFEKLSSGHTLELRGDTSFLDKDYTVIKRGTFEVQVAIAGSPEADEYAMATVTFNVPGFNVIPPIKTVSADAFEIGRDTDIEYKVQFDTSFVKQNSVEFTIRDIIDPCLFIVDYKLDIEESKYVSVEYSRGGNIVYVNVKTVYSEGIDEVFPDTIELKILTKYYKNAVEDEEYVISNTASVIMPEYGEIKSNTVTTEVANLRELAMNNFYSSIALQEAALAAILDAEGMKIQKVSLSDKYTDEEIMQTNKSVNDMINAISRFDMLLASGLKICDDACNEE